MAKMEWIELESSPCNEPCQQIGPNYNVQLAELEAKLYCKQIKEQFPSHDKVTIKVKTYYGDWTRFEARIGYDPNCDESSFQAYEIEAKIWMNWTNENRTILKNAINQIDELEYAIEFYNG
jgi:hypothetical protein